MSSQHYKREVVTDGIVPDVQIQICPKKSEIHAREMISQMEEMVPDLERLQREYTAKLAEFARLKKIVKTYAVRGIIGPEEIPALKKITTDDVQKGEDR